MTDFDPGPEWREVCYLEYRDDILPADQTATIRIGDQDPRYFIRKKPMPPLPSEPGTVIQTGPFWWLKCETYTRPDGTPGNENAWLLLPHRSEVVLRAMSASHLEPQVIYDRARVLEQADEYGFVVIAEPRAVTAKAVLDAAGGWLSMKQRAEIADEIGVEL